jgi:hypothetical protein
MQFHIFIQNPAEHHFTATVLGMPDWTVTGTTQSEALAKVESLLDEKLATGKIVTVDWPSIEHRHQPNPLMQHAGMFVDDPYADEREREIEDLI